MKKTRKFSVIGALTLMLVFTGCKDKNGEPETPITPPATSGYAVNATVQNGGNYNNMVDSVCAVLPRYNKDDYFLAGGVYQNGGFSVVLPETVPDSCLVSILELYVGNPDSLLISDSTAFASQLPVEFLAYKDGSRVGRFLPRGDRGDGDFNDVEYLYANNEVTVLDRLSPNIDIYELNLVYRKGWNIRRTYCYVENQCEMV